MKKLIAAILIAGVVMATGTVLALAADQQTFVCPGGNQACAQNGTCLQGECPHYVDSSFTCPGGNDACVQNGACLQGECAYYAGCGNSGQSSGTGHHRERGYSTGYHNR